MENKNVLSASEAAASLGVSVADVEKLVGQGILKPYKQVGDSYLFSPKDIERILSNQNPSISEEAAQVGIQIQREVVSSVTGLQKLRKRLSILTLSLTTTLVLAIVIIALLFKFYPEKTSDFFGYYYKLNAPTKSQVVLAGGNDPKVLAATIDSESPSVKTTVLADLLRPLAATSLVLVKGIDGQQYQQIVNNPSLGTGAPGPAGSQGPPGPIGTNGANGLLGLNGPQGPTGLNGTSGSNGIDGTNGTNGINGTSVADVMTTAGDITIRDINNLTARLSVGSNSQVLTISGGIPAWANSSGLSSELDTLTSVTGRGASTTNALTLSSASNDITAGLLRISSDAFTDLTGSGLSISSSVLNVAGLTNSNLSGSAGITNANLANSALTVNTSGPLGGGGSVSLGSTLSLTCATCLTSGGSLFTTAATSGSNSTVSQGGTLTLAAGSNITTTNNGSGTVTFATSSTPSFTTVSGLTITNNGTNTLTIAAGKTLTASNSLTFTGTDGTSFTFPSSSDDVVGRTVSQTLTNKTIAAGANTISALTNANLSGTAGITNANLANSSLTVTASTGLSGGGLVALGGSVALANAGVTSLIGTANQVNISASTGIITLSLPQSIHSGATPTFAGLTLSSAPTFSSLTNCGTLATNASGVVQCDGATGDTATFADTNPATLADNDTTELFNDAGKPNITPNITSQTVLVTVHVRFTGGGGADTYAAIRIVRNNGSAASCSGGTQVGGSFSTFMTSADTASASGTFLDAPTTSGAAYYTVCSSNTSSLGSTPVSNRVDITLVELGG